MNYLEIIKHQLVPHNGRELRVSASADVLSELLSEHGIHRDERGRFAFPGSIFVTLDEPLPHGCFRVELQK
jgi:hypothetical protein